jgi:hypothetical protein
MIAICDSAELSGPSETVFWESSIFRVFLYAFPIMKNSICRRRRLPNTMPRSWWSIWAILRRKWTN